MQTEVFWTLLVCLLCTIVLELFLISLKIEDWIEVSKIRQDSLDKMQEIKARYVQMYTANPFPVMTTGISLCSNYTL